MNADEPPEYVDPPSLFARHFLSCRTLWFDPQIPDPRFSLGGIYTVIEPTEGTTFPFLLHRVFVYAQLWGDEAEHRLRVRLVRLDRNEDDDEEEVHLGRNGEPREFPMSTTRPAPVSEIEYVNEIAFPIGPIAFGQPGLYEFQLWADGIEEPIARERILARE